MIEAPLYGVSAYLRVSIAATEQDDQGNLGKEVYFSSHFQGIVHSRVKSRQELTQGRNLEAGTDAEAMEGCCLLACSPWLAQPAFL